MRLPLNSRPYADQNRKNDLTGYFSNYQLIKKLKILDGSIERNKAG